jgi:hypothetical protein
MISIVSIVEGDGEVAALPVLLRRLGDWLSPGVAVNVGHPIRVRREQFLRRPEEFSKKLRIAAGMCVEPGWILILLDADDDCPHVMAGQLLEQAAQIIPGRAVSVVLANREFEAWFIAAAASLHGKRGFICPDQIPEAETIRGAKEWISKQVRNGAYHPVIHQPAYAAAIDLQQVHDHSRSFRKLCSDWQKMTALSDAVK